MNELTAAPPVVLKIFVASAAADMGCRAGGPAAQGSKKYAGHRRNRRTGKMAPLLLEQSAQVKPWRKHVAEVTALYWRGRSLLVGPVGVRLDFVMPRPKGTSASRTPPAIKRPDGDKLTRAAWDALTGVIWMDDSQVVEWSGTKRIAEVGERPGCYITVWCV